MKRLLLLTFFFCKISSNLLYAQLVNSWDELAIELSDLTNLIDSRSGACTYTDLYQNCLKIISDELKKLKTPMNLSIDEDGRIQPSEKNIEIDKIVSELKSKKLNAEINHYEPSLNYLLNQTEQSERGQLYRRIVNAYLKINYDGFSSIQSLSEVKGIEITEANYHKYAVAGLKLIEIVQSANENKEIWVTEDHSKSGAIFRGDKILKIEDRDVFSLEQAQALLKHYPAPKIELLRGEEKITITLEKHVTLFTPITQKILQIDALTIGYIKIHSFSSKETCSEFVGKLNQANFDRLIIDLRGNGGGSLAQVNCITEYLDKDLNEEIKIQQVLYRPELNPNSDFSSELVYSLKSSFQNLIEEATRPSPLEDQKIVLLIDHESASASELLAQVVQDNLKQAVVMGVRSFGKGTAQEVYSHSLLSDYLNYKPIEEWINEEIKIDQIRDMNSYIYYFSQIHRIYSKREGLTELQGIDLSGLIRKRMRIQIARTIGTFHTPPFYRSPHLVGVTPDIQVYPNPGQTDTEDSFSRAKELVPFLPKMTSQYNANYGETQKSKRISDISAHLDCYEQLPLIPQGQEQYFLENSEKTGTGQFVGDFQLEKAIQVASKCFN